MTGREKIIKVYEDFAKGIINNNALSKVGIINDVNYCRNVIVSSFPIFNKGLIYIFENDLLDAIIKEIKTTNGSHSKVYEEYIRDIVMNYDFYEMFYYGNFKNLIDYLNTKKII